MISDSTQAQGVDRGEETAVWGTIRVTFLVSSLLFLISIGSGFLNIVTTGELPRWQVLTHLHSGTVGWILLSYIGIVIWLFAGTQKASSTAEQRLRWLVWLAVIAFVGLIASFAYGYSQSGGDALLPLGVFAPFAAVMIWATAIFALIQLRRLSVVTTPHLLVTAGMLVAAIGVSLGAWVGLNNSFGNLLPVAHDNGIGAHILSIIPAVAVVATGVIEWMTSSGIQDNGPKVVWRRLQSVAWRGSCYPSDSRCLLSAFPWRPREWCSSGSLWGPSCIRWCS